MAHIEYVSRNPVSQPRSMWSLKNDWVIMRTRFENGSVLRSRSYTLNPKALMPCPFELFMVFSVRDFNIVPKKELHRRVRVSPIPQPRKLDMLELQDLQNRQSSSNPAAVRAINNNDCCIKGIPVQSSCPYEEVCKGKPFAN